MTTNTKKFQNGDKVEYFSNMLDRWVPAIFRGYDDELRHGNVTAGVELTDPEDIKRCFGKDFWGYEDQIR